MREDGGVFNSFDMDKKKLIIIGAVVVVLVVAGAASRFLGKSAAERAIEQATGGNAEVNSEDGTVTVKTDQGTYSTGDKLPSDFPADVPLYPGAKVQGSVAAAGQTGGGHYVGLVTSDSLDAVAAWYKSHVVSEGWTVASDATINGTVILGATKDNRNLAVTITSSNGQVSVGLAVTAQQQ